MADQNLRFIKVFLRSNINGTPCRIFTISSRRKHKILSGRAKHRKQEKHPQRHSLDDKYDLPIDIGQSNNNQPINMKLDCDWPINIKQSVKRQSMFCNVEKMAQSDNTHK